MARRRRAPPRGPSQLLDLGRYVGVNRVGRLEEIPPESREVFANGMSVCLAGQQLWITDESSGASADIRVSDLARPGPGRRPLPINGGIRCGRRPTRSGPSAARRRARLLAGRGHRAGPPAAAARRDETAWPDWNCHQANVPGRRSTGSAPCSIHVAWQATSTGTRCCHCMPSSLAAWPATSPGQPAHPDAPPSVRK